MGIFMPGNIAHRISQFIAARQDFPYVQKDEMIGAFYLYGREFGVQDAEVRDVKDMARKSVEQFAKDVRLYSSMPGRMDSNFTRENYNKRSLQIAVDNVTEIGKRVAGDPAILSDCFAQHVAYHHQGYYFELFQPFEPSQLPFSLRSKLERRMLLLGFNANKESLPFKNRLEPFFDWLEKSGPKS